MANISNVDTLKIHVMPDEVHRKYVQNNSIQDNELYLVSDDSSVLPISEGGTGVAANDIVQLRTALGLAAADHTSTEPSCGTGNDIKFGHVKLSDAIDSTSDISDGIAVTPKAVKTAYDLANSKADIDLGNVNITEYTTWNISTLPSSSSWNSVCYGNGKYVTVTTTSTKAAYSTDGITWTESTLPSEAYWNSVCYGDGKFVAIATNSTIAAYSTDGITWTASILPSNDGWNSVCYGDGKFVAIATNSTIAAYSNDGITWTASILPSSASWYSVCYGSGKFVAIARSSNKATYSTDGITWFESTLSSSNIWLSVCYGNDTFVTVSTTSNKAAYSNDGISWTESTLPSSAQWHSICYGDGKFVAVAYYSTKVAYSTDGITWTESTLPINGKWWSVCYGDNTFVTVTINSSTVAYLCKSAFLKIINGFNDERYVSKSDEIKITIDSDLSDTSTNPVENRVVKAAIDSLLSSKDAMVFKGTIGTDGTVTSLPDMHEAGWTYKVITAGTYAGMVCEVGDMIICIKYGTTSNNADWTSVQTNNEGLVTGPNEAISDRIAVFDGTTGKVIKDSGFTIGKSVPANAIFTDTVYTHPTTTATTAAAVKVGKDSLGHVVIGETITAADIGAAASGHGHSNATKTAAGFMSAADKTKLEGIADNANNYSHPTTSGNKHIPSGGSAGQFLKWSADGTAVWAADNNTTYSAVGTTGNPGLMTAADKVKLDGIDKNANKITVDSALSSSSTNPVQNKAINTALAGKANTSHTHTYVYIGTTAPSDTKLLWVDTANGLKYHNGSAWVVVPVAYS